MWYALIFCYFSREKCLPFVQKIGLKYFSRSISIFLYSSFSLRRPQKYDKIFHLIWQFLLKFLYIILKRQMLLQKAFTHLLNRATQNNVFKVIMKLQSNFLLENNFPCCFFNLLKKSNCVFREIKYFLRYQIWLQKEFAPFLLLISHHSRFQTLRTVYQLSEYI